MSGARQSVILCEGYDDRSFWAGWLVVALGCTEAKGRDPWGRPVDQGKYAYRTEADAFLLVHPCRGRERLAEQADLSLLAKWYGDHGCDDFFRAIWRDEAVRRELEARLRASGAWSTVEALMRG